MLLGPQSQTARSPSMEQSSGGGLAAKRSKISSAAADASVEDRLSALPDDVLVLILLRLATPTAARTSVLSRRWRHVWALLPELRLRFFPEPHSFRHALAASEVPLHNLLFTDKDASAESLAVWFPAAARRVSGSFALFNADPRRGVKAEEEIGAQRGAFEMPCFENATSIWLLLGFLGLALQPTGTFARLTLLSLTRVRFVGPCELGDMVSSPRCPCLRKLSVSDTRGEEKLIIHSESLMEIKLKKLAGLRLLCIEAPALKDLSVTCCLIGSPSVPVATISAPQLVSLHWRDSYDQSFIRLGDMANVRCLGNLLYFVHGLDEFLYNLACLRLLQRFKVVKSLALTLVYLPEIDSYEYLMENMTVLPDLTFLYLDVVANGHAFGTSLFHVFKMCTGLRRLTLAFCDTTESEGHNPCPSGCICDQEPNWKTEKLMLNRLQEIEIQELRGTDHELALVERFFSWGTRLEKMTVTFNYLITESKAKELFHMFRSFTKPGVCMKFYIYQNLDKVLYAPED